MRSIHRRLPFLRGLGRCFGLALIGLFASCGSNDSAPPENGAATAQGESARGAVFTVNWPDATSRVIPKSTEQLTIRMAGQGLEPTVPPIQRSDVRNGTATRTVDGIPQGRYDLTIEAKTSDGTTVARGAGTVDVPAVGYGRATVSLAHTAEGHPAVIAQAPSTARVNDAVTFTGSATDHGGSITRYDWDFGDNRAHFISASTGNTTHTYAFPGVFTATLTVTDNDGLTSTAQVPIAVESETVQLVAFKDPSNATVPTNNVRGRVSIVAQVLSERAVTSVEFLIDGRLEGRDSTPSAGLYAVAYDSTDDSDGQHTLTIKALMDAGDTLQAQQPFTVNNGGAPPGPTAVEITPSSATLAPGGTQQFSANLAVTWSIVEGSAGGSITQGGLYTAPATEGTYHVRAIDQSDPGNEATATVTVQAGGGGSSYEFVRKWGSQGSGDGQFDLPWGVAVDAQGNVYVSDADNHRIQKFTSTGGFLTQWGSQGSGDGQFNDPHGVAVDAQGNVYVSDTGNHRIQKFTPTGGFLTQWGSEGSGEGKFHAALGVAVDAQGNVYVTDLTYVSDFTTHRIQKFTSTGGFLAKWGNSAPGDGHVTSLYGVAVDAQGNVYVSDTGGGNPRIKKFTSTGGFLTKWGSYGSGDGQFQWPYGVAVDAQSNIYVSEWGNHRIQKFTSTAGFLTKWGSLGSGDGQFQYPSGVAVDAQGDVYVCDSSNHRIQVFRPVGN